MAELVNDPEKPETWTADYAWKLLDPRTMSLKLQELTLQMLEKLTAKIEEIWVEGVRRQNPAYTLFERLKLEEETAEEFAQKKLDSAVELWEAQGYRHCHGIYLAIQVHLIFPFFERRKESVSRDLLKGFHPLPERNSIEAALRQFSMALGRRQSRWRKRVEVLGREANLVLEAKRKAEEKTAAAKLAEKTDLSPETKASTKPKRTSRRMSEGRRWRRQVIFGVLQLAVEGSEYCRELDRRGLKTPEAWQSDGCHAKYAEAYKSQDFRRKIHDEKHYMKKKFDSMTPAERERAIDGTRSRTRK